MLKEKISSLKRFNIINWPISMMFWIYLLFGCNNIGLCQKFNPIFNQISSKDGLGNRYNEFIKKDSKGQLWISSTEGPYLFNGFNLKNYSSNDGNGLLGDNIQSNFIEDSKGDIWFTTFKGINRYLRGKDKFASYRLKNQNGSDMELGYNLFYIENDSILWLSVGKNIYSYNPYTCEQVHIVETEGVRFEVDTFPSGKLKTIVACPWVNNSGVQFINFDDFGNHVNNYFFKHGLPNSQNQPVEISKAIFENDNLVWLFSNKGLLEFNPILPDSVKTYPLSSLTYDLLKDGVSLNDQYLLVSAKNSGLWMFNKSNKVFEKNYSIQDNSETSLSSNSLREIYLDEREILWLSHYYKPAIDYTWIFNNQFTNPFDSIAGLNPKVNSIIEDSQSKVWCSTENNGVFVFQNKLLVAHYTYSITNTKGDSNLNKIKQLSLDGDGKVWGLSDHAIFYFHNKQWIKYHEAQYKIYSFIHSLDSTIIVSTNQGILELSNSRYNDEKIDESSIDKKSGFQVTKLFPSIKKRIFASNNGNTLLIFAKEDKKYNIKAEIKIEGDIYDILEHSSENEIWISASNGLWNLNLDSNILYKELQQEEALKNAPIISYYKGEAQKDLVVINENLWIKGSKKNSFSRFRKEDGLHSGQFSLFANLKDSKGEIWLGTNDGLVCFHPDSIKPYTYPSVIFLKGLKVNNNRINLENALDELNIIELDYDENSFEIDVLGITNYHPELTQIFYKLNDYNNDWKSIENNENIQFTKIPSGEYELEIYSVNANNIKSKTRVVTINILFPWWSNIWIRIAFTIGILLLSFWIFYRILNRKLTQQKLVFDALQNERNRIANEMHDDMGSGLYSIKILLQGVHSKLLSSEAIKKVVKVEEKTTELVENMRIIIWALDSGYDNLPDLVAYIRTYFLEFFDEASITGVAQIPDDIPNVIISGKERRNIFLCVKESIHNIAKHSDADLAELFFSMSNMKLIIEIKDNGKGIDIPNPNKFGKGLKNMKKRMEEIKGGCIIDNNNGTKIILEIPI